MYRRMSVLLSFAFAAFAAVPVRAESAIFVDCSNIGGAATPYLYGTCLEDLNREVYGGLYGQMIFGERFAEPAGSGLPKDFVQAHGNWRGLREYAECDPNSEGAVLLFNGAKFGEGSFSFDSLNCGNMPILCDGDVGPHGEFSGYAADFDASGDAAHIYSYKAGKRKTLGGFKLFGEFRGGWNRVGLRVGKGGKIEAILNGKSVGRVSAVGSVSNLRAGVASRHHIGRIKNFSAAAGGEEFDFPMTCEPHGDGISGAWGEYFESGAPRAKYFISAEGGENVQHIKVDSERGVGGIVNRGIGWGMNVRKGEELEGFIRMKGALDGGEISVGILDGSKVLASQKLDVPDGGKTDVCNFKLVPNGSAASASFALIVRGKGRAMLDRAMLRPAKVWNGANVRADIAEKVKESGVRLIRYGGTMVNNPEYKFKSMLGSPETRPAFNGFWYRYATLGFGVVEFVKFCEAVGAEPVFAINAEESPEDAADMVEYFNGSADTKWGARRAADGHPAPYGIKYVEIGNEEVISPSDDKTKHYAHYAERFRILSSAMRAKDGNLKFINAAWWDTKRLDCLELVFRRIDGACDFWDIHPGADSPESGGRLQQSLDEIRALFRKWNPNTKMKAAILEENGAACGMRRAVGHAGILNAVRRNSDFVLTTCPANALQAWRRNIDGWNQGQIFFTNDKVWGMPPFWIQKMDSENFLPLVVKSSCSKPLEMSAAISADGAELAVYVVNTSESDVEGDIKISGFKGALGRAKVFTLSAPSDAVNTPDEPERIRPVESVAEFSDAMKYKFAPCSYTILRFGK